MDWRLSISKSPGSCHRRCEVITLSSHIRCPTRYGFGPLLFLAYINNQKLAVKTDAKYLGVTISSDLPLGKHTDNITKKANSTMAFLKRNIRSAPMTAKDMAYKTFVRPTLEYASPTWAPYIERDNHKIDMVQRRAARFVTSGYRRTSSVTSMMHQPGWDTLQQRRELARLTMMYRIVHQLVAIQPSHT